MSTGGVYAGAEGALTGMWALFPARKWGLKSTGFKEGEDLPQEVLPAKSFFVGRTLFYRLRSFLGFDDAHLQLELLLRRLQLILDQTEGLSSSP